MTLKKQTDWIPSKKNSDSDFPCYMEITYEDFPYTIKIQPDCIGIGLRAILLAGHGRHEILIYVCKNLHMAVGGHIELTKYSFKESTLKMAEIFLSIVFAKTAITKILISHNPDRQ